METTTRQVRKSEKETRRRLVQQFKEARQNFVSDVVEGRRAEELFTVRVWKFFGIFPFQVPYRFRSRTIIDVRLIETYPGLRLTATGQLVHPPVLGIIGMKPTFGPFVWHVDRAFGVHLYSNDELSEMIRVFALPSKPIKRRWLEPTKKR